MAERFLKLFLLACVVASAAAAFDVPTLSFDEGYSSLFGGDNVVKSRDGKSVKILLNRYSGSGFISSDMYKHGFFSASIRLPSDYTAGVVVAFYDFDSNTTSRWRQTTTIGVQLGFHIHSPIA